AWTLGVQVLVHTGGTPPNPPQARKARRPTTADRTSVLCITSAEFGGSGGPSLTSERMAGNYWNTFAPGATHLSSPTSATKSAQSGHALVHRTCPLLGAKRTWPNRPGIYPLHDLSFSIVARLTCGRFYKRALADRFCLRIKCDFNHIRVRSFILTGAPETANKSIEYESIQAATEKLLICVRAMSAAGANAIDTWHCRRSKHKPSALSLFRQRCSW